MSFHQSSRLCKLSVAGEGIEWTSNLQKVTEPGTVRLVTLARLGEVYLCQRYLRHAVFSYTDYLALSVSSDLASELVFCYNRQKLDHVFMVN